MKRIVVDLAAEAPAEMAGFYRELFDLDIRMDMGWIVTLGTQCDMPVQMSVAREGGGGAPVPHLTIEVDDLDAVWSRAEAQGAKIAYPMTEEPWGVRRFFLCDPAGRILNVMSHI